MIAMSLKLAIWLVSDRPKRADEELALNAMDFHLLPVTCDSPAALDCSDPKLNAPDTIVSLSAE